MSAQPSSLVTPAHVFVTNREARHLKRDAQQFQSVLNRMLDYLGFPDKAARGVIGVLGGLNGREVLRAPSSFPALIPHKYMARQLGFKGKEENSDVFMGRYLDAIREAERACGRKVLEVKRADGVTTICTEYRADYIGEAALWALVEARGSEMWKQHPARAVTDELIERACAKLPACEPRPEGDGGSSITVGAVIKGTWTKAESLVDKNLDRIAEAGGDPAREARRFGDHITALGVKKGAAMRARERGERERAHAEADARMTYAGEE